MDNTCPNHALRPVVPPLAELAVYKESKPVVEGHLPVVQIVPLLLQFIGKTGAVSSILASSSFCF